MIRKKADVTIGFIVSVIVLLIGFALLLLIYYQFYWQGQVDTSVCHNSVVYRGTLPSASKSLIPLKCATTKICITANILQPGNCEEFKNDQGVMTMRVSNNQDGLDQIQKVYADQILSCWSMMGQGKVSLYSDVLSQSFGFKEISSSCVVCARVAIDNNSINKDQIDLSKMNIYQYMNTHLVPGKDVTYFSAMSGNSNSASIALGDKINLPVLLDADGNPIKNSQTNAQLQDLSAESDPNKPKETAIVFMQVSAPTHTAVFENDLTALGIGSGTLLFSFPKVAVGAAKSLGGIGAIITGVIGIAGFAGQQYMVSSNRAMSAGYCGDVKLGEDARSGCSVVRTLDYNAQGLYSYCKNIESIP